MESTGRHFRIKGTNSGIVYKDHSSFSFPAYRAKSHEPTRGWVFLGLMGHFSFASRAPLARPAAPGDFWALAGPRSRGRRPRRELLAPPAAVRRAAALVRHERRDECDERRGHGQWCDPVATSGERERELVKE